MLDLEWKIIYVGCAENPELDQILDTVLVGPLNAGRHRFVFQVDSPDTSKISAQDCTGVTVVLITCSYRDQEFLRIGYFVNNEYSDPEMNESPPAIPQFDKIQRNILTSEPRVTKFQIRWDDSPPLAGDDVTGENSTDSDTLTHAPPAAAATDGGDGDAPKTSELNGVGKERVPVLNDPSGTEM